MYRTLLLIICSTSSIFANLNVNMSYITNTTTPDTISVQSEKVTSAGQLTLNETDLQNSTVTRASFGAKLTLPVEVTTLNYSKVLTTPAENVNILLKIHRTVTRSKDAVWATITLTFVCVLLLLAVAQSKMWKGYRGSESQGVPLPDFNERVLFRDVMEHKLKSLKTFFKKQKKTTTEMESLLASSDVDGDEEDIP